MPEILLGRDIIDPNEEDSQLRLAAAYKAKVRATCLCSPNKPELYIALVNQRFVVKRMPGTGAEHATHCPTFDAPEGVSGLGPLLGSAISVEEDGHVDLKLGFALTLKGKRAVPPAPPNGDKSPEATPPARKLTLTSLLHYLWSEAELTRWSPGMAGKRGWGLVRHLLLEAASGKTTKSLNLADRLFIPEPFFKEKANDIARRHEEAFHRLKVADGTPQPVGLIIAEYKGHEKGRVGFRFTFKHMPDAPFYAEADLTARFERAFEDWLRFSDVTPNLHLVTIATFAITRAGYPSLLEIGMLPTSDQWIPIETKRDMTLLQHVTTARRRFLKPMRFNLGRSVILPSLLLTDAGPDPVRLYLDDPNCEADRHEESADQPNAPTAPAKQSMEITDKWPLWLWSEATDPPDLPPVHRIPHST
ncbi:MAG: DUF1173 family protein [Rhodobacteraceae bacterium]|nr:DUF1173 family protein [Paracoccaceae bacterium]